MTYTIKKLAKIAGVTVRTLHYYDELGLLKPSFVGENGYRYYREGELLRLQQILFYRVLELPLEEIKRILDNPNFDSTKALLAHKSLLKEKRNKLDVLIKTINKTLLEKENMKGEELFAGFDDKKFKEYQQEAKERWGHTDAYKQSNERTKNWAKEEFAKVAKEWNDIARLYAESMDKSVQSSEVQAVVEKHWDQINKFYDCTPEIFKGLAEMYVVDERFAENYKKYHQDLPEFIKKAMMFFLETKKA